ncbi:MAG: four helix bundle protein [Propionibacteriaceae bacterium]|nr:four helix bundle protein [Propionibacteriaceae bacterium]
MPGDRVAELSVITEAKKLCAYVMTVTEKSPKRFRFTFTSRLQNLSLDLVEALFRANDTFVGPSAGPEAQRRRLDWQHRASTDAKLLAYLAMLAAESGCLLMKQHEQIAELVYICQTRLTAWIRSDEKRLPPSTRARPA